jgi:hypothetical protein
MVFCCYRQIYCSTTDNAEFTAAFKIFSQLVEDKLVVLEGLEVFLNALEVANLKSSQITKISMAARQGLLKGRS